MGASAEVTAALREAGIEHADTEARFIVEAASGTDAGEWLEIRDEIAGAKAEARLRAICARRVGGEPLQYALGSWSFRGLDLMVDRRVLIPRPETEWVVEVALEEATRLGMKRVRKRPRFDGPPTAIVADLGTGSAAIALALDAELADVEVWATDESDDALAVASANVAGNAATRVRIASGSWFGALSDELRARLTLVVVNPPYIAEEEVANLPAEVANHEPRRALVSGPTGLEALDHVITEARDWLATPGVLVCEIAPHQADVVVARALAAGFDNAHVRTDLTGRPRVLVARLTAAAAE